MSDIMLRTENLGISFGGLKAVQDVKRIMKKLPSWASTVPEKQLFSICLRAFISLRQARFTLTVRS